MDNVGEALIARWLAKFRGTDLRQVLPHKPVPVTGWRDVKQTGEIVVHCSGAEAGDGEKEQRAYVTVAAQYHIDKDWRSPAQVARGVPPIHGDGLMYHVTITRAGKFYVTRDLERALWHAHEVNESSLAILCPGDFDETPTDAQLAMLKWFLDELSHHTPEFPAGRSQVFGHGDLVLFGNDTRCPGRHLQEWLMAYREGWVK